MSCQCHICARRERITDILNSDDPYRMRSAIKGLLSELSCAEFDLDWYKAIFHGNWPTAKEQLTRALSRIVEREAREKMEKAACSTS